MTTTIDVPLLRKALEHVTAHPEDWCQSYWITRSFVFDGITYKGEKASKAWGWLTDEQEKQVTWCGTTACLAGTVAVTLLGGKPHKGLSDLITAQVDLDGEVHDVEEVARTTLGLTMDQAAWLFRAGNTLGELWRIANEFTNGEIEIPAQFR